MTCPADLELRLSIPHRGRFRLYGMPERVFALELPKQPPPPTSIFDHTKKPKSGPAGSIPGAGVRNAGASF
jgi:hypothetical protein